MTPTCAGREKDVVYAEARGYGVTIMGRILVPDKRLLALSVPQEARCDTCMRVSRTRICPYCHFELPHDIGLTV